MVEEIELLPPGQLFPPRLENSEQELQPTWCGTSVHELYGDDPPQLIVDRLNVELGGILGKYDVVYMSAQKLVQRSLENGYLVGSRGSVGLVAGGLYGGHHGGELPAAPLPLPQVQAHRSSSPTAATAAARTCRTKICPVCGDKVW